jgi:predicted esterase
MSGPIDTTLQEPSPPQWACIGWWLARSTLVFLFLIGSYLSLFPSGRGTLRAAQLLPDLINLSNSASRAGIRQREQAIDVGHSKVLLTLYEPTTAPPVIPGSRGALIIVAGVGDNRANAQLVNLQISLAQRGVIVLSLTSSALINFILMPSDGNAIVAAYAFLEQQPGVNSNAIGIIGFSAGGALVSLGAADPRIRDRVAFIALLGSYFDTTQLLANVGHRALRDAHGNYTQPWHPNEIVPYALAKSVADLLPGREVSIISQAFQTGASLSSLTLESLSPAGAALYHLLKGDEPDRVDSNIAHLTPEMHMRLDALSPKSVADDIHAHIYLLHDRHDAFVPYTETVDFGNWLTAHHRDHTAVLFDLFQHAEVRSGVPFSTLVADGTRLFWVLASIMNYGA